jgi:phosphatidylserine decarboxylase
MNQGKAEAERPPESGQRPEARVLLQHVYPKRLLSALMYRATRIRFSPWKNLQIHWFIRRFGVDMSASEVQNPGAFKDFNSFFTRALKPGIRPLPEDARSLVSPGDGVLYDFGSIEDNALIQAKSHRYAVPLLLAEKGDLAKRFQNGSYFTLYLAPKDYHRVHMPFGGVLKRMVYVPGTLFSVNPATAAGIPGLFARNERVICWFETLAGQMAVVLVGAVFVGSIETVWHGEVTPSATREIARWGYDPPVSTITLKRGAEMGRFNMGSTVVVLMDRRVAAWRSKLAPGTPVQMGQTLATFGPDVPDPSEKITAAEN